MAKGSSAKHKYAPPTTADGSSASASASASNSGGGSSVTDDLPSWDAYGDDSEEQSRSSGRLARQPPLEVDGLDAMDEDLPRIILMTRLANLGMSLLLILVSLGQVIGFPAFSTWILSCYALCGACLICLLETQLKFLRVAIALNFGFLFSTPLRFLFYLLLSTLSWGAFGFFGRVVAIGILGVALFNAYVLWRYPSYRAIRERIAEQEDKLIEAKVSSEIKQQAVSTIMGSATAAASSAYSAATRSGHSDSQAGESSTNKNSKAKKASSKSSNHNNKQTQARGGNGGRGNISVGSFT